MELSLESLVSDSYPVKSRLKQYIHRIEKQWYIEYCIEHRHDLASYCEWYEVTKSYSSSRDHSEVKRIEVALSDGMPYLEIVYCKCANDPRYDKYNTNCNESAMVEMESHRVNSEIQITKIEYIKNTRKSNRKYILVIL